jgi:hypothetical protein
LGALSEDLLKSDYKLTVENQTDLTDFFCFQQKIELAFVIPGMALINPN